MISHVENEYIPDVVSPPGETLQELLDERGMTQAELAQRTGRPKKTINEIIQGKAEITPETALQLERVLGVPANFWNERERTYRDYLARLAEEQRLITYQPWLDGIPVAAMIKQGWIEGYESRALQIHEVLRFFGVVSPDQWYELWQQPGVVFRKSPAFQSHPGVVSAWLRQGELLAQHMVCASYNAGAFRTLLHQIRELTCATPEIFRIELPRLCAEVGVAVVIVPELPQTRVCGATRWLTPTKALIQLSLRYKRDDQFWFTFFHEAGHILLHGKREAFVDEEDGYADEKEAEANTFAAEMLIPNEHLQIFLQRQGTRYFSAEDVKQFAAQIGIAPGIVVGRLQHDGAVPLTHLNGLKRKLDW